MTSPTTRIQTYSRSKGHNALAIAAKLGALLLTDPRTDTVFDHRGQTPPLRVRCMVPPGSPDWADDPQKLWLAAEEAELRKDSTVARNFRIALPLELGPDRRWDLILDIAKQLVDRFGFAVQMSHHAEVHLGVREIYANILATTRRMAACGLTTKTRQLDGRINGKPELDWIRAMADDGIRRHLLLADGPEATAQYQGFAEKMAAFRGDIQVAQADGSFEALLHRYRTQGRLHNTSQGHSHVQAQSERDAPSVRGLPIAPQPAHALLGAALASDASFPMDPESFPQHDFRRE